jgi:hypothetical protein
MDVFLSTAQPKQNFTTYLAGRWQTKGKLRTLYTKTEGIHSKQLDKGENHVIFGNNRIS